VPRTRRRRTLNTPVEDVWKVVADPHHLPRWWPRVSRVEEVEPERWTVVLATDKGKAVRADYRLLESEPPRHRLYAQDLAGSPFERLFAESITDVMLDPAGEGTEVTIELRQKLRGVTRLGGFMLRNATRRQLDQALEGLEGACAR